MLDRKSASIIVSICHIFTSGMKFCEIFQLLTKNISLEGSFYINLDSRSSLYLEIMLAGCANSICEDIQTLPDLPLCLGVLKHRATLAREGHLPAKK